VAVIERHTYQLRVSLHISGPEVSLNRPKHPPVDTHGLRISRSQHPIYGPTGIGYEDLCQAEVVWLVLILGIFGACDLGMSWVTIMAKFACSLLVEYKTDVCLFIICLCEHSRPLFTQRFRLQASEGCIYHLFPQAEILKRHMETWQNASRSNRKTLEGNQSGSRSTQNPNVQQGFKLSQDQERATRYPSCDSKKVV
jgi:hypothetical protein